MKCSWTFIRFNDISHAVELKIQKDCKRINAIWLLKWTSLCLPHQQREIIVIVKEEKQPINATYASSNACMLSIHPLEYGCLAKSTSNSSSSAVHRPILSTEGHWRLLQTHLLSVFICETQNRSLSGYRTNFQHPLPARCQLSYASDFDGVKL